jgi:hypothetical protein
MQTLTKAKPAQKAAIASKAKRSARKPRLTAEGLMRILARELPPAELLPPNPVLVQRGSYGS